MSPIRENVMTPVQQNTATPGQDDAMTPVQRFVLGGVGALAPILLNLAVIDGRTVFNDLTLQVFLGYAIRVIIFFGIGGLIAYLHSDEKKMIRAFELGIAAPALITAFLNGASPARQETAAATLLEDFQGLSILPSAYAGGLHAKDNLAPTPLQPGDSVQQVAVKRISTPRATGLQGVFEGLTGWRTKSANTYFVIVGSHQREEDAKRQALEILQRTPEFHAEVFAPFGSTSTYTVAIGSYLSQVQAERLRDDALRRGFPSTIYVWSSK